jgi:hypothetical protein
MNIIDYLQKNKNSDIKKDIYDKLYLITQKCTDNISEGYFGKVYTPLLSPFIEINVKGMSIRMVAAIKQIQHEGSFNYLEKKNRLYLYSDRDLTAEAIILFYVSKWWYNSMMPYSPFLANVHNCFNRDSSPIDHLVTQRYGMFKDISTEKLGPNLYNNGSPIEFSHKMETLWNVLLHGLNTCDDKMIFDVPADDYLKFPGGKLNLVDFMDNIILHTLIAFDYFQRSGIALLDQHSSNIVLEWIGEYSTVGAKSMSKVKNIYYPTGKKGEYIVAPVNMCIPKLIDLGSSVLKLRDDLWIIADLITPDNHPYLNIFRHNVPMYHKLFDNFICMLPYNVFKKTKLYKIYEENEMIGKYNENTLGAYEFEKMPTPLDLLTEFYKEQLTTLDTKTVNEDENFIIKNSWKD